MVTNKTTIQLVKRINKLTLATDAIAERQQYTRRWVGFDEFDHAFTFDQRVDFFDEIKKNLATLESSGYPIFKWYNRKQIYNVPVAFDIETSSFYLSKYEMKKRACMYIWQFGFNGSVIYGRTWEDWFQFLQELASELGLCAKRLIYIYVHNLSFEFQWIRKFFEWDHIFALKKRKVLYARYESLGFEFRCSYLLANASLAHVGEKMLQRYKWEKDVGDLDYSKVRHALTPLTKKELGYCLDDVRVQMCFIQEKIENDGGINSIPLTNTGYVRNYCRKACMGDKYSAQKYHALMASLTIDTEEEYDQNKRAIAGGFTHAGIKHANKIRENVGSADLISSYPAEMVGSYYPMSAASYIGAPKSKEQFIYYLDNYCCIFDVKFTKLLPKVDYENYLSISRCIAEGYTLNNGRIVSAESCLTTMTELDFDIVQKMYTWEEMEIANLRIYTRGYLPKSIITAVLGLYANKTKLKDIPEEIVEYLRSKNMANASFGMMLTDIIRPEHVIDENDMWATEVAFKQKQLKSYNKNFNRFLYYTWGIYVTAHARHNLFEAIMEFGDDYVYADTDSIKGINFEKHLNFFKAYNYKNRLRMKKMCEIMDIDFNLVCPKTNKGEEKMLGDWEIERGYRFFKTAGAKRYMYIYPDGELCFTIAGLNKKNAIPYLLEAYPNKYSIMKAFRDGLTIPAGYTGKVTVTYIDDEIEGQVTDYLGVTHTYHELSAVHMEPQSFSMSQTDEYLRMIQRIEEDELR